MRPLSRSQFLKAGSAASLALMTGGCSYGIGQTRGVLNDAITVWEISTGDERTQIEEKLAQFNAAHPDVPVSMQFFENDPYKQKLWVSMGANSPPDILYGWGGGVLQAYVDTGHILEINRYLEEDPQWGERFLPSVMEGVTFNDKIYGVPISGMQPNTFFYNKTMFNALGLSPPETWGDLLATVDELKRAGKIPIAIGGGSEWNYLLWEQELVDRLGGPEVFEAVIRGEPGAWSHPAFLEANAMIQDLVASQAFESGFPAVSYDTGQSTARMYTEQAGMQLIGVYDFENYLSSAPEFIDEHLGWFRFPAVEGGEGDPMNVSGNLSNFYSISSNCNNVEGAITFLKEGTLSIEERIAQGEVPPVENLESKLRDADRSEWLLYVYDLVQQASHFQLSWDQALLPSMVEPLLTNMGRLFLREISPREFSAAMNQAMKEAS